MLLRVQSPEGTRRIEVSPSNSTSDLFKKIGEIFGFNGYSFSLFITRDKSQEILPCGRDISSYGLAHGDMIFLSLAGGDAMNQNGINLPSTAINTNKKAKDVVVLDDVDKTLQGCPGTIERKRDPKTCLHGDNSSCIHCLSIEPYDSAYLKEHNIKHMSFHAYMRKLSSGLDKGKFANLENVSCRIKPGCTAHPPWPRGVCSKCQPKAITLNSQPYRHVDHIVFENPILVERFLHYWRATGSQRIGFLYGRFDVHLDVPLGIKGIVAAIYEPPQESTRDSVKLLLDPHQNVVNEIAAKLGLTCIGWIFTDLLSENSSKGTVRHFRNANNHFLSAQECIMAGHFQSLHPNPCLMASTGKFGSKFATICVTGDSKNQVHMEGYQVSNQCQALVQDGCLIPTKDAPELAYVRQSSQQTYIPDVYYKEKDSYGNEVTRIARPLPVEYLLLDVPVSTPLEPLFTFYSGKERAFPVANRPLDGHLQDVSSLASYLKQFAPNRFIEAASDFHFLIYIATMDMFPLMENMAPLLEAIKTKDAALAEQWALSDQWCTVTQLLEHANSLGSMDSQVMEGVASASTSTQGQTWTCLHCTFINLAQLTSCEICNLPNQV